MMVIYLVVLCFLCPFVLGSIARIIYEMAILGWKFQKPFWR